MKKLLVYLTVLLSSFLSTAAFSIDINKDQNSSQGSGFERNAARDVYANWLFTGAFSNNGFTGVNPDYRISQGDMLLVQLWGGIDFQQDTKVDAQGNIFIPKVGPVKVQGVRNKDLNSVVLKSIKRVYKSNVEAYVTLASSQTVKVFLSGMVNNPGLYEGQSADSILAFIDRSGGIRESMGSYRDIKVKRNGKALTQVDLYKFIEQGVLPTTQLQDGDVIFVSPKVGDVIVSGEVGFEGRYEVTGSETPLKQLLAAVAIKDSATHVTIVAPYQNKGMKEVTAKQYSLDNIDNVNLRPGSTVKVSSQLRANSISVEVVGEHESEFEMVVPWGATLKDLLAKVEYSKLSNKNAIQLYRQSVAKRQKDMLLASLQSLEQSVLTARSATTEAAKLRAAEAETILKWIEKAKQVKPRGQVLLADGYDPQDVILQQGDKVVIPSKQSLVMIHGEVLFPTAITYDDDLDVEQYIGKAGGATSDIDDANILVMKPNGSFVDVNSDLTNESVVAPGDEIFVLAKPDVKSLQLTKDITQILYQVAVSAAVVVAL